MTEAPGGARGRTRVVRLLRGLRLVFRSGLVLAALLAVGWGSLALALDGPGRFLAGAYALCSVALPILVRPRRRGWLASAALFALVLAWWLSLAPRNDRDWLPDVSQLPSMRVEGERLIVSDLRNFEYRSETEFTPRWEERSFDLARVTGLDLVVCDWGATGIVHTILSWEFADGEHLAVSIETRKERGEGYSALKGFFRQFELYYVVGDERDLLGVRAGVRGEALRLYRLDLPPDEARELLLVYAGRINRLIDEPAWYNAINANCTTSIRLHAQELGLENPWNWRILVNGRGEELLYMRGAVNTSLPFDELRARSDVSAAARAALGSPDFSALIRRELPPRPGRS